MLSSWFGGGGNTSASSPSKSKYSVKHLQGLYATLSSNAELERGNYTVVVECIRQIAELVVYGDQNTQQIFDYFAEKSILSMFLRILKHPRCNNVVKIQIIQTVSILVRSIKSETSLYYMLSNNHINEIISHPFDFKDEEVLSHYISFLKTLSLMLNSNTIQFFFTKYSFPVYQEACKFLDHDDAMVRTAVRTITLNVFRVQDAEMRAFIFRDPNDLPDVYCERVFERVIQYLHLQCRKLHLLSLRASSMLLHTPPEEMLASSTAKASFRSWWSKIEDAVDDVQGELMYLQDMFALNIPQLNDVVCDSCVAYLFYPLLVASLKQSGTPFLELNDFSAKQLSESGHYPAIESHFNVSNTGALTGLLLLSHCFTSLTHAPLVNQLIETIFSPTIKATQIGILGDESEPRGTPANWVAPNNLRDAFFEHLQSKNEPLTLASVCALYCIVRNQSIDKDLLMDIGLAPARAINAAHLFKNLMTSDSSSATSISSPDSSNDHPARPPTGSPSRRESCTEDPLNRRGETVPNHHQGAVKRSESDDVHDVSRVGEAAPALDLQSHPKQKDAPETAMGSSSELLRFSSPERYPFQIVGVLLSVLKDNQSFAPLTVRVIAKLLVELTTLDKPNGALVTEDHAKLLQACYNQSVDLVMECKSVTQSSTFLEYFEQEWEAMKKGPLKVEHLLSKPDLLVPMDDDPALDKLAIPSLLGKRAMGEDNETRRAIRSFLVCRLLYSTLLSRRDPRLSNLVTASVEVREGKAIDLRNSEYLPVQMVHPEASQSRHGSSAYMVIVAGSVILAALNPYKVGTGIIRSVAPIYRTEAVDDTSNPRMLHLCVYTDRKIGMSTIAPPRYLSTISNIGLNSKRCFVSLIFSSAHHASWAKNELNKSRMQARSDKMGMVNEMFSDEFRSLVEPPEVVRVSESDVHTLPTGEKLTIATQKLDGTAQSGDDDVPTLRVVENPSPTTNEHGRGDEPVAVTVDEVAAPQQDGQDEPLVGRHDGDDTGVDANGDVASEDVVLQGINESDIEEIDTESGVVETSPSSVEHDLDTGVVDVGSSSIEVETSPSSVEHDIDTGVVDADSSPDGQDAESVMQTDISGGIRTAEAQDTNTQVDQLLDIQQLHHDEPQQRNEVDASYDETTEEPLLSSSAAVVESNQQQQGGTTTENVDAKNQLDDDLGSENQRAESVDTFGGEGNQSEA